VSADGNFSIEFVECLASCGTAPVCMVNDALHENIQPEFASELIRHPPSSLRNSTIPHPLERRLIFRNIGRADW
jgi:hypothetical protein